MASDTEADNDQRVSTSLPSRSRTTCLTHSAVAMPRAAATAQITTLVTQETRTLKTVSVFDTIYAPHAHGILSCEQVYIYY